MNLFINIMPALKNMGLEFPDGILEQQIKNLEDGLVHKDYILLGVKLNRKQVMRILGDLTNMQKVFRMKIQDL